MQCEISYEMPAEELRARTTATNRRPEDDCGECGDTTAYHKEIHPHRRRVDRRYD